MTAPQPINAHAQTDFKLNAFILGLTLGTAFLSFTFFVSLVIMINDSCPMAWLPTTILCVFQFLGLLAWISTYKRKRNAIPSIKSQLTALATIGLVAGTIIALVMT